MNATSTVAAAPNLTIDFGKGKRTACVDAPATTQGTFTAAGSRQMGIDHCWSSNTAVQLHCTLGIENK